MKPPFFTGFSYSLLLLSVFGALASLSETFGMRPFGEPIYQSSAQAFFDFILHIWGAISLAMMVQRKKNSLGIFNASFGANAVYMLKDSYDSPWEASIVVVLTIAIYWFYNRNSVRNYLGA